MDAEILITNEDLNPITGTSESELRAEFVLRRVLQGDSAYEVWLKDGHTGEPDDFFDWLRQGPKGDPGRDSYLLTIVPSRGAEIYRPN